jgi:Na+-transporting NADH:ubiquinone oxidoreductase subunit NqrB
MLFRDTRDYQILFLSTFLVLGLSTRDWTLRLDLIWVTLLVCLFTQAFLSLWTNLAKAQLEGSWQTFLSIPSWRSALITALGLCLLLRANQLTTMAIAASLAIASKFLFRLHGKHFFNPANFGIIAALTLTQDAWVSPGQWGTDGWYLLGFAGAAGIVLKRVGRWDTSVTFLVTYAGLESLRNAWLGWSWDVLQHQLMSGSLLLFALFMITDPRSIPNASVGRIVWSVSIAFLAFIIQQKLYLTTAIFWALFILSPLTILLDFIWLSPRFSWQIQQAILVESREI